MPIAHAQRMRDLLAPQNFHPRQVKGLVCDIDPAGPCWQDTARTIPAGAGDTVSSMPRGQGVYIPVGAAAPTLVANGCNGLPVLRFAGAQELYDSTFSVAQPHTSFVVLRPTVANVTAMETTGGTSPNRVRLFIRTDGGLQWYAGASVQEAFAGDLASFTFTEFEVGATSRQRVGGIQGNNATSGNTWAGLRVGKAFDAATFYTGDFARILVYNRALTLPEAQAVRNYLTRRYNVPAIYAPDFDTATNFTASVQVASQMGGSGGNAYFEQDGGNDGKCYQQFSGFNVGGNAVYALVSIEANGTSAAHSPYTVNEATHAGICTCFADISNFYIFMFSQLASANGERTLQFAKKVAGVETLLASSTLAGITLGTRYVLKVTVAGGTVTGTIYDTAGTQLGQISAADGSFTTGDAAFHVFSCRARFWKWWLG